MFYFFMRLVYDTYLTQVTEVVQCNQHLLVTQVGKMKILSWPNSAVMELLLIYYKYLMAIWIQDLSCSNVNGVLGVKNDDFGMTLVSFNHLMSSSRSNDEPFIFAHDVSQVFYIQNDLEIDWNVVPVAQLGDFFEMQEQSLDHKGLDLEADIINASIIQAGESDAEVA